MYSCCVKERSAASRFIRGLARQTFERWEEWRYGIRTEAVIPTSELGISDPGCHHYVASSYRRFHQTMKQVRIRPGQDVFADFGSGMGRAVILAAQHPFRKVIGIEISRELNDIARDNLQRVAAHLQCKNVELHCADIRAFPIPPDLSMAYLWSPFDERILSPVFANLRRSVEETPRPLTILYTAPVDDDPLIKMKDELNWLETEEVPLDGTVSLQIFRHTPVDPANDRLGAGTFRREGVQS